MSSWKKVKGLFWKPGDEGAAPAKGAPSTEATDAELSDEDFAKLLSGDPNAVPQEQFDPVQAATVKITPDASGALTIDFQAQYDAAGIPDTDEVEQLENFLARLDGSLPKASKIAAAQAFLGAIGKDKSDVLEDAARKIKRVHGILRGKEEETRAALAHEQQEIDALQAKIEAHRKSMEAQNHELEGVRQACLVEESRLQAARVFFGNVEAPGPSAAGPGGAPRQK
jgi:hypothetical protein